MSLDQKVKETWQKVQAKHAVPVNALGVPIRNDENALKIWKEEGIDGFMKQ